MPGLTVYWGVLECCQQKEGAEMLRPSPGFATYPAHHCVTGSLKRVYDYHGWGATWSVSVAELGSAGMPTRP